jgi:nitrogen regulatory protein PII
MQSVKRIEIVTDSIELSKIIEGLKQTNVTRYTVIRNVTGNGIRGTLDLDIDGLEHDYVVAICLPEQLEAVVATLRPILNRFGGICLISDALEIRSIQCLN